MTSHEVSIEELHFQRNCRKAGISSVTHFGLFYLTELTYLKLTRLDISRNRIASLPVELKNMSNSLEILRLTDNPLMAPPAVVCYP